MTSAKELLHSIKFRHGGCIQNGLLLFHPILVGEVQEELHGHEMNGMLTVAIAYIFLALPPNWTPIIIKRTRF